MASRSIAPRWRKVPRSPTACTAPISSPRAKRWAGFSSSGACPGQLGEERQAEALGVVQACPRRIAPGCGHRHALSRQLGEKVVLLLDLGVRPALGAIELDHPAATLVVMHQVDPVLVAVEGEGLAGQPEAERLHGRHHPGGREGREGVGRLGVGVSGVQGFVHVAASGESPHSIRLPAPTASAACAPRPRLRPPRRPPPDRPGPVPPGSPRWS